jgi:hypothetical protein
MLSVLVLTLALYFLWEGRTQAINSGGAKSWRSNYWRMDSTQLGAAMLGVFAWDAVSLALDRVIQAVSA